MSRLVVVSNRLADPHSSAPPGGLAVALRSALRARGGLWAGWTGALVEDEADTGVELTVHDQVSYAKLTLPRRPFEAYYDEFSNGVLWPLLHARPDLVKYDRQNLDAYREVNRTFAKLVYPLIFSDDLVWVHDYHLLPLAAELRSWGLDNPIGFFLHVPFPAPDVIRALPERNILVAAIASYTVFGVQTLRDKANVEALLMQDYEAIPHDDGTLEVFGRRVRIEAFPIGIEAGHARRIAEDGQASAIDGFLDQFRTDPSRRLILGVDRLDYSKGLPQKLEAFDGLLDKQPDLAEKLTFLQIAPLTREAVPAYQDLRCQVEQLAGRINARHGTLTHQPLLFLTKGLPHNDIMRALAGSHVAYVTSLMDGMNLVAKEYVDAQDPEDPGVLVLSSFAGAAEEMQSALIVNPYDRDEVVRALQTALAMPKTERRARHRDLMAVVERTDVRKWARSYVAALAQSADAVSQTRYAS